MSQKLIIVKYELEDDIPIDESSENLMSSYAPPELISWIIEKGLISEINIKESLGEVADIPVSMIDDSKSSHLEDIFQHIEAELIRHIESAHSYISKGLFIPKEIDKYFSELHIWLEVRNLFKEKKEKYSNNNIKLVVG